MGAFQWSESHVDWFVERFKGEQKELDARSVQRKYGWGLSSQDFRNLMRLVVQLEHARVTNGCVTSKKYRIRMKSEQYPYETNLFDKALIEYLQTNDVFPDFYDLLNTFFPEIDGYNCYQEIAWDDYRLFFERIIHAFSVYNLRGGDYDTVWESHDQDFLTPSDKDKDLFCLIMRLLTKEYIAYKIVIPEIRRIAEEITGETMPEVDANSFFARSILSVLTLSVLKHIKDLTLPFSHVASNRTLGNIMKKHLGDEIQKTLNPWNELSKLLAFDASEESLQPEYSDLLDSACSLQWMGETEGLSHEALDALKKVNEAYFECAWVIAGSFLSY